MRTQTTALPRARGHGQDARPLALAVLGITFVALLITVLHYWTMVEPASHLEGSNIFYKDIPGIDLVKLSPSARSHLLQKLNHDSCTCGCRMTLAHCSHRDPDCPKSLPVIRDLMNQVKP